MGEVFMRRAGTRYENGIAEANTQLVVLANIHLSQKNRKRLARDRGQIEELRKAYECGVSLPPITLIERDDGGFDIDDGRHRFLAAELAGLTVIEALIL